MKRYRLLSLLFVLVFAHLISCRDVRGGVKGRRKIKPWTYTASSNKAFANELFRHVILNTAPKLNVVVSPLVVSSGLSMTLLGADGDTASELMKGLKYVEFGRNKNGQKKREVHKLYKKVLTKLTVTPNSQVSNYTLNIVNRLFGEKTERFLDKFINETEVYYKAKLKQVNYAANPEGARNYINNWIAQETHDNLVNVIPPGLISPDTLLTLVSAIYLKGKWKNQFDPENSFIGKFKSHDDDLYNPAEGEDVCFMKGSMNIRRSYSNSMAIEKFVLPYEHAPNQPELEMEIYLPSDNTGMLALERMPERQYRQLFQAFHNETVELNLPRFTLDFEMNMVPVLRGMGVTALFDPTLADLSQMNGEKNLSIGSAMQKSFISVSEEGTEAAAVFVQTGVRSSGSLEIFINRPFIFKIVEPEHEQVLFMGRVTNPGLRGNCGQY